MFFKRFINSQIFLSKKFDEIFLPAFMSVVGWREFYMQHVPAQVEMAQKIYDIGSGKRPSVYLANLSQEKRHGKDIIGVDISEEELNLAPEGFYTNRITADICNFHGKEDGDLAICGCLLEHVADMKAALRGVYSCLAPGGRLLIFVPSRNALFARLNMVLPENFKNWMLKRLYPQHESDFIGFKAHYDCCTPEKISKILSGMDMEIEVLDHYYFSNYFMFFSPVHVIWRLYQLIIIQLGWKNGAENFIVVARKKNG